MHVSRCGLLVVCLLPVCAAAEDPHSPTADPSVFACMQSETFVMGGVLLSGERAASQLFERIGVELHWSCQHHPGILVRLAPRAPRGFRKGTLAYALPFAREGVRVTVFYDRLEPILEDHLSFAGNIFGHVLAHEIGHVLERLDSHAPTGLMQAHWTEKEFAEMRLSLFDFAPDDAQFIHERVVAAEPR
jgi:hypothetical protein